MSRSNVEAFRPAAELAMSRNREEALRAIVPRLLQMSEAVVCQAPWPEGTHPATLLFGPGLCLQAFTHKSMLGATCVDVRAGAFGPKLFSAWLNCPAHQPGKYMNGKVHVMSWTRGWESAVVAVRHS